MNLLSIAAEFHGTPITIIDHAGKKWLTAEEAGLCLGYNETNASAGIRNLYNRHLDRFDEGDACRINLMRRDGRTSEQLCFSDTGCITLGWLANTKRAIEFQRWAKQVLANHMAGCTQSTLPAAGGRKPSVTRAMEHEVLNLFVSGLSQSAIHKRVGISPSAVNLILHGRYRFSPGAGHDLTTPELIAAVTQRHIAADLERLTRKYCASAANQHLESALDGAGHRLLTGIVDASTHNVLAA